MLPSLMKWTIGLGIASLLHLAPSMLPLASANSETVQGNEFCESNPEAAAQDGLTVSGVNGNSRQPTSEIDFVIIAQKKGETENPAANCRSRDVKAGENPQCQKGKVCMDEDEGKQGCSLNPTSKCRTVPKKDGECMCRCVQ